MERNCVGKRDSKGKDEDRKERDREGMRKDKKQRKERVTAKFSPISFSPFSLSLLLRLQRRLALRRVQVRDAGWWSGAGL